MPFLILENINKIQSIQHENSKTSTMCNIFKAPKTIIEHPSIYLQVKTLTTFSLLAWSSVCAFICNQKIIIIKQNFKTFTILPQQDDFLSKMFRNKTTKSFYFFKILFIYFQREGKEGENGGRETSVCGCPSHPPPLGTWPATHACALTGNQTKDPLVCRVALNPLSHTSQGKTTKNF